MEVTGQKSENGKWFVLCTKTSLSADQADQSQHNKSAKHNNTQEQTAKTAPALSEFSKKIAAMNTRLQGQMDTMKEKQDAQMDEMLKSFKSRFTDMQEHMDESHRDPRSLIVTMQQTMHNMMEKNNNMGNTTRTTRGTS
eukprot:scaffold68194_cov58-Attheya_sp.AAC.15